MSQPIQPPPVQPYGTANPYAQQPPQPYGQPPQQPGYGVPPQAGPPPVGAPPVGAPPVGPPAPAGWQVPAAQFAPQTAAQNSSLGLGLLAAVGAALAAVFLYAAILRYTDHEIGYVALAVGLLVGAAAGKAGGRNAVLPVLAVLISLLAVWFGQLVGIAWSVTHHYPDLTFNQVFFSHFGDLVKVWKNDFVDAKDILFFAIAGVEGFVVTRRVAQR